jgi:hypothetical protein
VPDAGEPVTDELGADQHQDDHHDHGVVVGHELLDHPKPALGGGWGAEVEEHRAGDGDRSMTTNAAMAIAVLALVRPASAIDARRRV